MPFVRLKECIWLLQVVTAKVEGLIVTFKLEVVTGRSKFMNQ